MPAAAASTKPEDGADAELIRLCAEFNKLQHQIDAHFSEEPIEFWDDAWDEREAALEPLYKAQGKLAEVIHAIPSHTQAGMVAKLRSFVAFEPEIIEPGSGPAGDIILDSACRDALAFPNTAVLTVSSQPPSNPDAELIALCDEFATRLGKIHDLGDEIPDNDEREKVTKPLYAELDQLAHRIWPVRAHTLDGIRAKARHIALSFPDVLESPSGIDNAYFASILRDLLEGGVA